MTTDDLLDMITDLQRRVEKLEECPTSKRFTPPTIEQIAYRMKERGITGFTAESFHAFYTSNGWMIGKNKMKSWDAALTTWAGRSHTTTTMPKSNFVKFYTYNDICQMALTNDNVWREYVSLQLPDRPKPVWATLNDATTNDLIKYKV